MIEEKKTYGDTVPIFIDHHHAQQHTKREEEQPIDVVFYRIAYRNAECEQENLTSCVEGRAKDDITDWPSILESTEYEDELRDDVHRDADERPKHVYDVQCYRRRVGKAEELLESGDSDEEGSTEDNEARYAEELEEKKVMSAHC